MAKSYLLYLAVRMRRYGSLIKINPSENRLDHRLRRGLNFVNSSFPMVTDFKPRVVCPSTILKHDLCSWWAVKYGEMWIWVLQNMEKIPYRLEIWPEGKIINVEPLHSKISFSQPRPTSKHYLRLGIWWSGFDAKAELHV